jgi:TP901 family phage tail tape measure protein
MADIESNIKVNIDTSDALSQLKLLQQQISVFQQAMKNAGQANAQSAAQMQQNLMTTINATGKFSASIQTIRTSAESFTQALEKNKLSTGEYFKYAGGASKTFGKLFKSEFDTIQQVAVDRVKTIQTQYIKLGRDASGAMKAIAVRPLALDMESLGTKTQIAAQKQQLFNQLMKQGSTQLLNFGKNTQWAGRQLMVGFTIPLTLMGQAAAKAYMEIEAASVKFRRVYGDMNTTTEEANKMVKSVQALANEFTKYGLAVAETMDMAASAAAMGKTGADLLAQVNQASKLAILGGVDQQQALETTISLTNTFGVSTKELAENVDFLNAVENQTVVSIEDLTIAIPKAAPVVRQLGGDVKDLAFFLTAMKEGGINASEGANALKSGMASLINPTEKASKFMKGFGINVKGIVEANKGDIKGTVVEFANALDTLDPLNRARAIEQMFGKFQFSRLSTLFSNVIDEGSQAATVAGLTRQTTEELAVLSEREMKKVADSPMFKFQKSIEDMQAKLAPVGEAFLKAVTPIIEFVSKILDGFNNLSEGTKNFVSMLVLAVAGIGPVLLMTFGLIANGVANIMKLFTNMKSFINRTTRPSDILGEQTAYMNSEQLKSAAIAASLDQSHSKLRQTFTSEAAALEQLTTAYRNAVQAQQAFSGVPGVPVGNPNAVPKKYANGVSMVPGPAGAGDIVPALLSPGEAVIPARSAKKYAPVIRGMIAGNLPGFEEGTAGVGMRQSMIGPMTEKQIEGVARTCLLYTSDAADE